MQARFTTRTLHTNYTIHSGQMVEVRQLSWTSLFEITAEDGWVGVVIFRELSECSPDLRLFLAKQRILGEAV